MIIDFEDYQIFYSVFLEIFTKREGAKLKGKGSLSPTIWDSNSAKALEIFGGGRINSARYFYRLHDLYKPEKAGKGDVNDYAFRKALEYIGVTIPETVEKNKRLNSTQELDLLFKQFMIKYAPSNLKNNEPDTVAKKELETTVDLGEARKEIQVPFGNTYNSNKLFAGSYRYLLSSFEIVELFCEVLIEFDKETDNNLDYFSSMDIPTHKRLNQLLKLYNEESLNLISNNVGLQNRFLLYEMKLAIQAGSPHIFYYEELELLISYIGLPSNFIDLYNSIEPTYITDLMSIEGSCWIVYLPSYDPILEQGFYHGALQFLPFGRVKLKIKEGSNLLVGKYYYWGIDNEFISLEFKQNDQWVTIQLYCGPARSELMVGQFQDPGELSSRKIVMEYSSEEFSDLVKSIDRFKPKSKEDYEIIRQYLLFTGNNKLDIPLKLTTYALLDWYVIYIRSNNKL